ncbi:MAG: hypothetical protein HZA17_06725 [Nitrospirae bacterium]|nr:hypothetical protein [Nitrospirota bacterium]
MELINRIYKKSLIILLLLAAVSVFIEWKKLPAGVLIGGILGLANIRGLAWGVEGLLGSGKATARMIFFSVFRLTILLVTISLLVYLRLVNIFGILGGLTVVFLMVIFEGLRYAKGMDGRDTQ